MVPFELDLVSRLAIGLVQIQFYSYVAALWGAFLLVYRWYHLKTGTVGVQVKLQKLRKLH